MGENVTITHNEIIDYIKGEISKNVRKAREGHPQYNLLLKLIDQIKEEVTTPDTIDNVSIPKTFDQTEHLLSEILAGNNAKENKQKFLGAIYYSPDFYQKVVIKIGNLIPAMEGEIPEEIEKITMQSDEQLLAQVMEDTTAPARLDLSYKIPLNLWEKIKEFLSKQGSRTMRYVYAPIATIVILFSGYFGLRFYNTTYQLMRAANLLHENYKIYMSDTPRLSGNYGSTGIAQLMGDEEEESFLNRALEHITQAQEHQSKSNRIQEIQAQIFIIDSEWEKAESAFDQLADDVRDEPHNLNDLGVLKFYQGDYEAARQFFEKAIELDADFVEAYYNLALVEEKLGNKAIAIRKMEQLLVIESDEGWRNAANKWLHDIKSE
jgi:tetratricopeptide (TPR) repeat protein